MSLSAAHRLVTVPYPTGPASHTKTLLSETLAGTVAGGLKRAFDTALAAVLLVLASPLILAAATLVRLTSRGPAFYSQTRLGRGGVPFTIYKLRTMYHNCEKVSGPQWSRRGDPRVTPLGRVLRKLHIDELPQLVNVIGGDMALVGPRPERPVFATNLEASIPDFADRLAVRPGVTGLAQVQFPPDSDLDSVRRKLAADLLYIRHASPGLDLRILLCTVLHVLHLPHAWRRVVLGRAAAPDLAAPTPAPQAV
jgi:lipopolysaccharide/colanic/teichoic acid biosynthesis glycosyltransferase